MLWRIEGAISRAREQGWGAFQDVDSIFCNAAYSRSYLRGLSRGEYSGQLSCHSSMHSGRDGDLGMLWS